MSDHKQLFNAISNPNNKLPMQSVIKVVCSSKVSAATRAVVLMSSLLVHPESKLLLLASFILSST